MLPAGRICCWISIVRALHRLRTMNRACADRSGHLAVPLAVVAAGLRRFSDAAALARAGTALCAGLTSCASCLALGSTGEIGLPQSRWSCLMRADPLVVIDAGHGGHDPGASGQNGVNGRRPITLALAKALREAICWPMAGCAWRLTRRRVTASSRSMNAPASRGGSGADLFVSVHADAARNRLRRPARLIYTLSDQGVRTLLADAGGKAAKIRPTAVNGVPLGKANPMR